MDTVYLFGAGINCEVTGPDDIKPPLARDFFSKVLKPPRLSDDFTIKQLAPLFDFIQKFWHLDKSQLLTAELDLEECFTFIELQRREAYFREDPEKLAEASGIQGLLTGLLFNYLSHLNVLPNFSPEFVELGRLIYVQGSPVLTFNYDTLLESAIENASPPNTAAEKAYLRWEYNASRQRTGLCTALRQQGLSEEEIFNRSYNYDEISDEHIAYSHHLWNPFLAYKPQFDEITLQTAGLSRVVSGERYYGHLGNAKEHAPFLKLHGSLGWYVHSGYWLDGTRLSGEAAANMGKTVLERGRLTGLFEPPKMNRSLEILLPLIMTPVLNKPYDEHPVFQAIWTEARKQLEKCQRLVVGGYSFPPTDFHVRRLLREVFCDRSPQDLCVINPDHSIVRTVKCLCNYRGPVMLCNSLAEFIQKGN